MREHCALYKTLRITKLNYTFMKKTKFYSAPELEYLPMSYLDMLCDSATGGTEDYELIENFEW